MLVPVPDFTGGSGTGSSTGFHWWFRYRISLVVPVPDPVPDFTGGSGTGFHWWFRYRISLVVPVPDPVLDFIGEIQFRSVLVTLRGPGVYIKILSKLI